MYIVWLKFIICAGLIVFAGKRVAKYADIIAEEAGLSRVWIGVILVAAATSLPELFTGIGSVSFVDAPNLTIGNLMGANSYNLLNIAFMDLVHRGGPLLSAISTGQLLTVVFSLIPLMLAMIAIILSGNGIQIWAIGNVGIFSIGIIISYFILTRMLYTFEKNKTKKKPPNIKSDNKSKLKKACKGFALSAAVIVFAGVWLAYIGKELTALLHLNESFVGTLLMGFVTTLPEITVSIAALFIGAREIAIANMFGSNLFNMTIIFVDDILYRRAPILQSVSMNHVWSACIVMAMTAVIILAMVTKPKRKFLGVSWYVPALFIIFLLGAYFNFLIK